jgi:hypothetical protein
MFDFFDLNKIFIKSFSSTEASQNSKDPGNSSDNSFGNRLNVYTSDLSSAQANLSVCGASLSVSQTKDKIHSRANKFF